MENILDYEIVGKNEISLDSYREMVCKYGLGASPIGSMA